MFAVVKANGRRRACLWSSRRVYADLNGAINIGLKFERNLPLFGAVREPALNSNCS